MTTYNRFRQTSQALWGVVLLAIGTILLLSNLDVLVIGSVWHYWPFLIVAVGIGKFLQAANSSDYRGAVWLMFLGLWLFVSIERLWGFGFRESWPFLLIAWGIGIVWKSISDRVSHRRVNDETDPASSQQGASA